MTKNVYVIDFDGVLYDQYRSKRMYVEAIEVIKNLKIRGEVLAIATRRSGSETEEMIQLLRLASIYECFDVVIANSCKKPWHLQQITDTLRIKYPGIDLIPTLYDDFDVNIKDVIEAGYKGVLVDNTYGLRYSTVA